MPHIEFDLDAKKLVPKVARALGVADHQIGWGLLELWEWCWAERSMTVRAHQVPGFFGIIQGDLTGALEAFGFLSPTESEGEYMVRGAAKRLGLSKVRSEAGKKGGQATNRGKSNLSNLKQVTEAKPKQLLSNAEAVAEAKPKPLHPSTLPPFHPTTQEAEEAAPPPAAAFVIEPPTGDPADWTGQDFWRWVQGRRQASGLVAERWPRPEALSRWWSAVRMVVTDVARLQEAFYRYGADKFWEAKTPPHPWSGFQSEWQKYVPQEFAA